jgi:hypothetical protein
MQRGCLPHSRAATAQVSYGFDWKLAKETAIHGASPRGLREG